MAEIWTDISSESDSDEEFFDLMLPVMVKRMKLRKRVARDLEEADLRPPVPKKRGGQVGRTWTQRKRGEIREEMFGWMSLIKQADVGNPKSKNGKVTRSSCMTCVYGLCVAMTCVHDLCA